MRTFIEPGSQAIIGNKHLPQQIISGPAHVLLFGRRLYSLVSTIPRWLLLTSQELPCANQVPVVFRIACNWSRDLSGFTGQRLYPATRISDSRLEAILRLNLEISAAHYVSFSLVENLVAMLDTDEERLSVIKRNHRRLACCLAAEMKQRLGGLGLVINALEVNLTLPDRLQQEVEELWRLRTYHGAMLQLTHLKLARAVARGQLIMNLVDGKLLGEVGNYRLGDYLDWPEIENLDESKPDGLAGSHQPHD